MRRTVLVVASMFLATLLASGVAWAAISCKAGKPCKGDESRNVMFGSNGSDIMRGLGAADSTSGENGRDKMYGGDGSDGGGNAGYMFGGFGNDLMKGGKAPDALYEEEDDDRMYGGPGHDTVDGGNGRDKLYGGDGNDSLDSGWRDGVKDLVDCGPGNDFVSVNSEDTVRNCEQGL
jgi:Ca2+-binding RTX toxin-like protein